MLVPASLGTAWKSPLKLPASHKLSPPRLEGLVSRSRLLNQMDQSGGLVTIVGPPVCGKTCLAASWAHLMETSGRSSDVFWYQIDDADGDIATFFRLIDDAVAKRSPQNPRLPTYHPDADLTDFTAAWLKALLPLKPRPPAAFIFDDVHRLSPEAPLLPVLVRLARTLGDDDHLILMSREAVPARITDAARRHQRLVRITDLKIDACEYPDFERSVASSGPLTPVDFQAALRHSGNWMTGLPVLRMMGMPAGAVREKLLELLAGLRDAERAALVATAYFQVGLERDWALLGGNLAVEALAKLETGLGLVRRLQNQALRKHDTLFEELRDWAEATALTKDLGKARSVTGHLLIQRGEVLSGVQLLIAAEAFDEARAAILDHAHQLIDQAKNRELLDIIAALPADERSRPAVRLWAAYARLPFSPDEAAAELAELWETSADTLSVAERALAINGQIYGALATMHVDDRMPRLVTAAAKFTVELTAVQEPMRSRALIGRPIAILLGAPTYRGHGAIRREAEALLPDLTPESQLILGATLVTHLLWWEGDVELARTYHRQIAEQAQHPDAAHIPVINWYLGALGLAFRDADEQALEKALKALEHFAKRRGLGRRLAPAYWMAAQAYAALGNCEAADKTLKKYSTLNQAAHDPHEHEEHFLRGAVALSRGDFDVAAREATVGWHIADRCGALHGRWFNALVLAISLGLKGDDAARAAIDEVAQAGLDTENRIFGMHAALSGAAVAHAKQRWRDFEVAWKEVTRLSLATGIRTMTAFNADAAGRMACDALLREIEPETTRLFIQSWRLLPPVGEPPVPAWPYRLEVNCLGRDEPELTAYDENGQPVSIKARSKTKSLLALLVSGQFRTLSPEALIDGLWPEAKVQDAGNNLRQQINIVRGLTTYHGIIFENGLYSLNHRLVMTDVQRLEEAIQTFSDRQVDLSRRIAAFDYALELYRGPLLPDNEDRLVAERREGLASSLISEGAGFLTVLTRQNPTKAALQRNRLAKLARWLGASELTPPS